jgi:GDPmannose 4,6-dehydratase
LGDASKAREKLGWKPKVTFDDLVKLMTDHDLQLARQEAEARELKHNSASNKARWGSG